MRNMMRPKERFTWKGCHLRHYRFRTLEEYVLRKMNRLWPTDAGNGGKDALNDRMFFRYNRRTKYKESVYGMFRNGEISILQYCPRKGNNLGDALNTWLMQKVTGYRCNVRKKDGKGVNYSFIGSMMPTLINDETIVFGAGVAHPEKPLKAKPYKVCSVRGPITRDYLLRNGVKCPEVYGDPALLLPKYYNPTVEKRYKYGLIPHWQSLSYPCLDKFRDDPDIAIIDFRNYKSIEATLDLLLSCENIISESLHGLIIAEAYCIPNVWAYIQHGQMNSKYHDFFLSIGRDREKPVDLNVADKESVLSLCDEYERVFELDTRPLEEALRRMFPKRCN